MKPMKLEVFARCGCSADEGDYIHYQDTGGDYSWKRLTDAELAAEYWRAREDYNAEHDDLWTPEHVAFADGGWTLELEPHKADTLLRFATLPHYDEVPE